jgi:aryl-alcohol dehydrogenase-like predicted oxidoreductase
MVYLCINWSLTPNCSKANEYARNHGFRQFSVYQGRWSAASRDFERDIIPMCRDEGMALAPWGALGGGKFKTEEQRNSEVGRKVQATEVDIQVSKVLEKIAARRNTALTSVALAYVMQKTPYVFPIVGGRNIDQLKGNIEALTLQLTDEDVEEIESAYPFDIGFPNNMLWGGKKSGTSPQKIWLLESAAHYEYIPEPKVCILGTI